MSTIKEKIQAAVLAGQYLYPLQKARLRELELIKPLWLMEAEQWLHNDLPRLVQEAEARGEQQLELGPNKARALVCVQMLGAAAISEHSERSERGELLVEYTLRWEQLLTSNEPLRAA